MGVAMPHTRPGNHNGWHSACNGWSRISATGEATGLQVHGDVGAAVHAALDQHADDTPGLGALMEPGRLFVKQQTRAIDSFYRSPPLNQFHLFPART